MPAVLVEVGFINSNTDNQLFDDNFDAIAQAIASGILDTLEMDHVIDPPGYKVQVGAFRNPTYANRLLNELLEQDFPASIVDTDGSSGFRSAIMILWTMQQPWSSVSKEPAIQPLIVSR